MNVVESSGSAGHSQQWELLQNNGFSWWFRGVRFDVWFRVSGLGSGIWITFKIVAS